MTAVPSAENAYGALLVHSLATTDAVSPLRFITWRPIDDRTWTGSIGLDRAGTIERNGLDFLVTDWAGELVGRYASLDDAKLTLEPHSRALARDQAEADARLPLLARLAGWIGLGTTLFAAFALLFFMPQ